MPVSARPADEQVADVVATIERLEAAWSRQTTVGRVEPRGSTAVRSRSPASCSPAGGRSRCTGPTSALGYGPQDWPGEYVREDLGVMEMRWNARRPMGMTGLPETALAAPPHTRLAWLLGRAEIDGLDPAGIF